MAISARAAKMLWGRAAGRCSICRRLLVVDQTAADGEVLIGEMCHMVAEAEDGPRGRSPLTREQRDAYENLILLCRNDHGEVDGQPETFGVERLKAIKAEHEQWVREALPGYDVAAQRDDEIYAGYVDEWATRCDLPGWKNWTSWLLGGDHPQLETDHGAALRELGYWLLGRIWRGRHQALERAFTNFRLVLQDLLNTFHEHSQRVPSDSEYWTTIRFYKLTWHEEEMYQSLLKQYIAHVGLIQDLILELTRAANFICDEVRSSILPSFWLEQGRIMVESGPHMPDFSWRTHVIQYSAAERAEPMPYPGLEAFKAIRFTRDLSFGEPNDD